MSLFDDWGEQFGRILDRGVEYGLEKNFPLGEPNPTPTATASQTQQQPVNAVPPANLPVNVAVPQVPNQPVPQTQPSWLMPAAIGGGVLLLAMMIMATGRR